MDHDNDLPVGELLERATPALSTDAQRLVSGGMARGRALRRRQRAGTAVAAVAVFGVIGAGAAVVPHLVGQSHPGATPVLAHRAPAPSTNPGGPKRGEQDAQQPAAIEVKPREVPGIVGKILHRDGAGPLRTDPAESSYGDDHRLTAHFSWQGTLASVIIEAAGPDPQGACAAGGPGTTCTSDAAGDPLLTWGPTEADGVTAQGVTVWRRGFEVSVLSYNAADGKDVAPLMDAPPLSIDDLARVAEDDAWFE